MCWEGKWSLKTLQKIDQEREICLNPEGKEFWNEMWFFSLIYIYYCYRQIQLIKKKAAISLKGKEWNRSHFREMFVNFLFPYLFSAEWYASPLKSLCVHCVLQRLSLSMILCVFALLTSSLLWIGKMQQEFLELER